MASRLKNWRKKQKKINQYIEDSDEEVDITHDNNNNIVVDSSSSEGENHEDEQHGSTDSDMEVDSDGEMYPRCDIDPYVMSSDDDSEALEEPCDENVEVNLNQSLAKCAIDNGWTHNSIDQLLAVLRDHGHGELPKTARTLLKCPRDIGVTNKCGGEYVYLGLKENILRILNDSQIQNNDTLELLINVDGLPLYKSSPKSVWGILCVLNDSEVFVVCLYYGKKKPEPVDEYLFDFLSEWRTVRQNGISIDNKTYHFRIKAFMCDAPARAFLKGIVYHTGYNSCERCTIKGGYDGRVIFNEFPDVLDLRKEEKFCQFEYPEHQRTISPLVGQEISLINGFVLDYMHLVMLGVVRRYLTALVQLSFGSKARLSANQRELLNSHLLSLNGCLPSEFSRQPRPTDELQYWKATEFRQFLLYVGPIVLYDILSSDAYEHFMYLSIGISILMNTNDEFRNANIPLVKELLKCFVLNCKTVLGNIFCVYNVHGLLHLHEDVEYHQCSLNDISCFSFENFLQKVKRSVRSGRSPLVQICKRQQEKFHFPLKKYTHFTKVRINSLKDGVFTDGENVLFVKEKNGENYTCDVFKKHQMHDVFSSPCSSRSLNIFLLRNNLKPHSQRVVTKNTFKRKMVCLLNEEGKCLFPMLHEIERH